MFDDTWKNLTEKIIKTDEVLVLLATKRKEVRQLKKVNKALTERHEFKATALAQAQTECGQLREKMYGTMAKLITLDKKYESLEILNEKLNNLIKDKDAKIEKLNLKIKEFEEKEKCSTRIKSNQESVKPKLLVGVKRVTRSLAMMLRPVIDDEDDPPSKDSSPNETTEQLDPFDTSNQIEQSVEIVKSPNLESVGDSDIKNKTQQDIILTPDDKSEETIVATSKVPCLENVSVLDPSSNKIETKLDSDLPDKKNTKPVSEIDISESKITENCQLPVLDAADENMSDSSVKTQEHLSLPQLFTDDTEVPENSCGAKEPIHDAFFPIDLSDDENDELCSEKIILRQKKTKSRKILSKQRQLAIKRANLIQAMLNLITKVEQHMKIKAKGGVKHQKKQILRKGTVIDYKKLLILYHKINLVVKYVLYTKLKEKNDRKLQKQITARSQTLKNFGFCYQATQQKDIFKILREFDYPKIMSPMSPIIESDDESEDKLLQQMAQALTDNLQKTVDTSTQTDVISTKNCKTQSSPLKLTKNNSTDFKLIIDQFSKESQTDFIPTIPSKIHQSTKQIQTDLPPLRATDTQLLRHIARNRRLLRRVAELNKIIEKLKRYIQKYPRRKVDPLISENTVLSKKLAELNRINKQQKRYIQNQKIKYEKRCKQLKQKYSSHVYNPFFQFANPLSYSFPNVSQCPPVWQPCNSRCNTPCNKADSRCNTPLNKSTLRSNNTPYKSNRISQNRTLKKNTLKKCFGTSFTSSDESTEKMHPKSKEKHVTLNLSGTQKRDIRTESSDSEISINEPLRSPSNTSESEESSVEDKCEISAKIPEKINNQLFDCDTSDTFIEPEPDNNKRKKTQPELKLNKKPKIDTSWDSVQEIHQKKLNILNTSDLVEVSPIMISPNLGIKTSNLGERSLSIESRLTRSGTKILKSSELLSSICNQRNKASSIPSGHESDEKKDTEVSNLSIQISTLGSTPKFITTSTPKQLPIINPKPVKSITKTTEASSISSNNKEILENSVEKVVKNHLCVPSVETLPIVPKIEVFEKTFKRRISRIPNLSIVSKNLSINSNANTPNMKNIPSIFMNTNIMKEPSKLENQGAKALDPTTKRDANVVFEHPCTEKELHISDNQNETQHNITIEKLSEDNLEHPVRVLNQSKSVQNSLHNVNNDKFNSIHQMKKSEIISKEVVPSTYIVSIPSTTSLTNITTQNSKTGRIMNLLQKQKNHIAADSSNLVTSIISNSERQFEKLNLKPGIQNIKTGFVVKTTIKKNMKTKRKNSTRRNNKRKKQAISHSLDEPSPDLKPSTLLSSQIIEDPRKELTYSELNLFDNDSEMEFSQENKTDPFNTTSQPAIETKPILQENSTTTLEMKPVLQENPIKSLETQTIVKENLITSLDPKSFVQKNLVTNLSLQNSSVLCKEILEAYLKDEFVDENLIKAADQLIHFKLAILVRELAEMIAEDSSTELITEFTPPAPPLTTTQQKVIALTGYMENKIQDIQNVFLSKLHDRILKGVDILDALLRYTRVYISICRLKLDFNRARILLSKVVYQLDAEAVPIAFVMCITWPDIIPEYDEENCNILVQVIVYTLLWKSLPPKVTGYNKKPLIELLTQLYQYQFSTISQMQLAEKLMTEFAKNENKSISFAILIFSNNQPNAVVKSLIIKKLLENINKCTNIYNSPKKENGFSIADQNILNIGYRSYELLLRILYKTRYSANQILMNEITWNLYHLNKACDGVLGGNELKIKFIGALPPDADLSMFSVSELLDSSCIYDPSYIPDPT